MNPLKMCVGCEFISMCFVFKENNTSVNTYIHNMYMTQIYKSFLVIRIALLTFQNNDNFIER